MSPEKWRFMQLAMDSYRVDNAKGKIHNLSEKKLIFEIHSLILLPVRFRFKLWRIFCIMKIFKSIKIKWRFAGGRIMSHKGWLNIQEYTWSDSLQWTWSIKRLNIRAAWQMPSANRQQLVLRIDQRETALESFLLGKRWLVVRLSNI